MKRSSALVCLWWVVACQPGELTKGVPTVDDEGLELLASLVETMTFDQACAELNRLCRGEGRLCQVTRFFCDPTDDETRCLRLTYACRQRPGSKVCRRLERRCAVPAAEPDAALPGVEPDAAVEIEPDTGALPGPEPDAGVALDPDAGATSDPDARPPVDAAREADAGDPQVPGGGTLLWTGDMEEGDMRDWYDPQGSACDCGQNNGGEYNSGSGVSSASTDYARSGQWSAKLTINGSGGVRLFRWGESRQHKELYYSVWYYFPKQYQNTAGWWNVFQWKSKNASAIDPFFLLDALNRDGRSYLSLYEWQPGRRIRYQPLAKVEIPIGKWFRVTAFYRCAGDSTGKVTIWQDGTKLFDVSGVRTRFPDGDCQWSVNNYSGGPVDPSPTTIYVDDAAIHLP
jgi:hypothetical protein